MLRAIMKRTWRDSSGATGEGFETIDVDVPEIEQALRRGGSGETGFDLTDFVGFEVIELPTKPRFIGVNINEQVLVKLTDKGREILLSNNDALPDEDEDGWSTWQLWELMRFLGRHCYNGCEPPFELAIRLLCPPKTS